jgi:amino acid adenylation domain-containing protein
MSIADILRSAASLHPDRTALHDTQNSYTYFELEELSSGFAKYLLSRGTSPGDRVALCAPKSASVVIAVLGCLKARAIYVPVDHQLPVNRLIYILDDVSPRFLVADTSSYEAVSSQLKSAPDHIDTECLAEYLKWTDGPSLPEIRPTDAAYCLYTSGSTGLPKGVIIEHGSVDAFYAALEAVMSIDASSRCMNTSELHFDVHVMDLLFPLRQGAVVHLTSRPHLADELLHTLEKERITHFTAVGPLLTLMCQGNSFNERDLSSLRQIMTGAEIININTVAKWMRKVAGLTVINGYGPTEATVICTCYRIDHLQPDRSQLYPIGKPMKGTQVLLLQGDRIITEPMVSGELLISGPQLMRGYWKRAGETQERLYWLEGRPYYRSGDICRWLPDGTLDYQGRDDDEVKISGFRVSLSEIKRIMDLAAVVKEGYPVVTQHPEYGKVIAACFTPAEPGDQSCFRQLQLVLKRELPYYMLPLLYVEFDQFPRLPSGKTDKSQILSRVERCIAETEVRMTRLYHAGVQS